MPESNHQTCQHCRFWKRGSRSRADELSEYRRYRPCALGSPPEFTGRRTLDRTPRMAPDATCKLWQELKGRGA